jgi:outer membrane protein, protease secretion system
MMKHPLRKTGLALAVALLSSTASGLDLQQAYQLALQQDATVRASQAARDAGLERLPQARAQLLPSVQASMSRNRNDLDTITSTTTNSQYTSFGNTVTLRQPLFNLQRYFQYEQAQHLVADVQASHQRTLQDLAVRVGSAYMEALLTTEQLRLVQSQKQQYSAMVAAARKALAAGSGTRTDIDDAQSRLDMAIASELEAQQNVEFTRRQLETLVNEPVTQLAGLNLEGFKRLPSDLPPLQTWLALAEEKSPELQSLAARRDAAQKEIAKAKAGHAPTLDAVVQWSDSGNENVTRLNSRFVNTSMGFQLVLPLFQGGSTSSQVRQAVAEKTRAEETLEAARRDLGLRVNREYRGVTEGELKVRALEQAVRSAEQLVISTQKSRQAGIRTVLDVLNAEQQLSAVQRDLMQARYLALVSRLRLYALSGQSPEESIREVAQAFQP